MYENKTPNIVDIQFHSGLSNLSHFHQEIELIYVQEGILRLRVMERQYQLAREDVCVINSNEEHGYDSSGETISVHVFIRYPLIQSVYNSVTSFFLCNSASEDNGQYEELRYLVSQLIKQKLLCEKEPEDHSGGFDLLAAFYKLLAYLTSHFIVQMKTDIGMTMQQKYQLRTMQINEYIMNNFRQPISLKTLSENLYLSEGYLSRYFRTHYHMSFTVYLRQVRLANAKNDLMFTDKPVLEIALDNGFSSSSFFNRVFKKE